MQWLGMRCKDCGLKMRLLCSADAAQQRHNVEFLLFNGPIEGGLAATAGKGVSRKQEIDTTQNQ